MKRGNIRDELLMASKEYINKDVKVETSYNDVLPLVPFNYKSKLKNILGCGFSISSFILPDLCAGLIIGNEIKDPVNPKYRYSVKYKDIKKNGVKIYMSSNVYDISIKVKKKARKIRCFLGLVQ